jgi:hypothetical protein
MTRDLQFAVAANDYDQPWKNARMNKITSALALGAGLALSLATSAHADPIVQSLTPTTLTATQFSTDFQPITAVLTSPYSFENTTNAGVVQSQVFQGVGALAGLYAYAYQVGVNNTTDVSINQPTSVNSASMLFDATPYATNQILPGVTAATYVVPTGQVGEINVPQAASGATVQTPTSITWLPSSTTGSLTFQYLNPSTNSPPLGAGDNGATIVVISTQPLGNEQLVSLQNPEPQTSYPAAYSPKSGPITGIPAPEPATILGWAGAIAAVAVGRRIRRTRKPA